jgi:hypothetical protein
MIPATTLAEAIAIETVCISIIIDTQKTTSHESTIKDYIMNSWKHIG